VGVCSPTPGNMVPIDMTRNPEVQNEPMVYRC
jgi:hypothetical protein